MELTKINENEIKITLSKQDLLELDLTCQTIDYNTTKTRKAIWEIFDRAKIQTGFDAAKNRIYVRLYPLSSGGCEMYVSKMTKKDRYNITRSPLHHSESHREIFRFVGCFEAFKFDNFESLYIACGIMQRKIESSLFLNDSNEYILVLKSLKKTKLECERIYEFSVPVKIKYIHAYLAEHCTVLLPKNAIENITDKLTI